LAIIKPEPVSSLLRLVSGDFVSVMSR